jgi:hypothetical protein
MPIACSIAVSILCLNVPAVSEVRVKLSEGGLVGLAAIDGKGWHIRLTTHTDVINRFRLEGASRVCVQGVCVDYRKRCIRKEAERSCTYDINTGVVTTFSLTTEDEAAARFAEANVGLHREASKQESDFPLALLTEEQR